MTEISSRSMIEAASTATAGGAAAPPRQARPLAEGAAAAAAEPIAPALSPIVLAGAVRMIELALVALIGTAIYVGYVVPHDGVEWQYFAAIAGISVLAMLA